jgi:hypothetical protein
MSENETTPTPPGDGPDQLGEFHFQLIGFVEAQAEEGQEKLPGQRTEDIEEQARFPIVSPILDRLTGVANADPEKVLAEWEKTVAQMKALVSKATTLRPGDLPLDSVSFSLTFNAKAGVWVFAEVGASATVQMTFKRTPKPEA